MQIDYNSLESVTALMKQSALPKFKIQRAGANKNSTPIFECLTTTSNAEAINRFTDWANLIENSNAYEMIMFENIENAQIENPDAKTKKGKVIRFVFALNGYSNRNNQVALTGPNNNLSTAEIIKQVVEQMNQSKKDDAVLTGLQQINQRLDELEEEEEEDPPAEPSFNIDKVMFGVHSILDKLDKLRQPVKKDTAIAGPVENGESVDNTKVPNLSEQDLAILNKAINILRKSDPDIAKNLMTLALVCKDNNATYQMGINYLASMNK